MAHGSSDLRMPRSPIRSAPGGLQICFTNRFGPPAQWPDIARAIGRFRPPVPKRWGTLGARAGFEEVKKSDSPAKNHP